MPYLNTILSVPASDSVLYYPFPLSPTALHTLPSKTTHTLHTAQLRHNPPPSNAISPPPPSHTLPISSKPTCSPHQSIHQFSPHAKNININITTSALYPSHSCPPATRGMRRYPPFLPHARREKWSMRSQACRQATPRQVLTGVMGSRSHQLWGAASLTQ